MDFIHLYRISVRLDIQILEGDTMIMLAPQNTDFVRIIQYEELRAHFNVGNQWRVPGSLEAVCTN